MDWNVKAASCLKRFNYDKFDGEVTFNNENSLLLAAIKREQ